MVYIIESMVLSMTIDRVVMIIRIRGMVIDWNLHIIHWMVILNILRMMAKILMVNGHNWSCLMVDLMGYLMGIVHVWVICVGLMVELPTTKGLSDHWIVLIVI